MNLGNKDFLLAPREPFTPLTFIISRVQDTRFPEMRVFDTISRVLLLVEFHYFVFENYSARYSTVLFCTTIEVRYFSIYEELHFLHDQFHGICVRGKISAHLEAETNIANKSKMISDRETPLEFLSALNRKLVSFGKSPVVFFVHESAVDFEDNIDRILCPIQVGHRIRFSRSLPESINRGFFIKHQFDGLLEVFPSAIELATSFLDVVDDDLCRGSDSNILIRCIYHLLNNTSTHELPSWDTEC